MMYKYICQTPGCGKRFAYSNGLSRHRCKLKTSPEVISDRFGVYSEPQSVERREISSAEEGGGVEDIGDAMWAGVECFRPIEHLDYHPIDDLIISVEPLGSGNMGDVFLSERRTDGKKVALKEMHPGNERDSEMDSEARLKMAWNWEQVRIEISMSSTRHPNLISCDATYEWDSIVALSLEYIDGGTLWKFFTDFKAKELCVEEIVIAYVLREILKGISFMHGMKRLHRDIKSANVLLGLDGRVKIGDYGFCAQLTEENPTRDDILGTRWYMSPEVINGVAYDYDVDIWAIGIVAFEFAALEPPFWGSPASLDVKASICTKPSPILPVREEWSPEYNDFLALCVSRNPDDRPTAEGLLGHQFLKKAGSAADLAAAMKNARGD